MGNRQRPRRSGRAGISRRTFMHGMVAASAVTGIGAWRSTVSGFSGVGRTTPATELSRVLTIVLNRLIPAEGRMPAAGDLGISDFVERAVAEGPHLAPAVLDVVGRLPAYRQVRRMSGEEVDVALRRVERERPASFETLLQIAYAGYYSHPRVVATLGWVDPDEPVGHLERLDPAITAEVAAPRWTREVASSSDLNEVGSHRQIRS